MAREVSVRRQARKMDEGSSIGLRNPFVNPTKPDKRHSMKFVIWEVLKDFQRGLTVTEIVAELEKRQLRDFSGRRNAPGQVSGDLVRHRDVFIHDPDRKVWIVRQFASPRLLSQSPLSKTRSRRGRPPKNSAAMKGEGRSVEEKPKGKALVGARVSVWWAGDNRFFDGEIVSFDADTDSYTVIYDDGDADRGIQFRKYDVSFRGMRVEMVRVYETDQDELELAANAITQLANSTERVHTNGINRGPECPQPSTLGHFPTLTQPTYLPRGHGPMEDDALPGSLARENGQQGLEIQRREPQGCPNPVNERPTPSPCTSFQAGAIPAQPTGPHSFPPPCASQPPSASTIPTPDVSTTPPPPPPPCSASSSIDLGNAASCTADHIASTLATYRSRQVEMVDLYNRMRGSAPCPLPDSTLIGDLGERLERTAWDSGQFARPIELESAGWMRLTRFCIEAFIKTAGSLDENLDQLLFYANGVVERIAAAVPDSKKQEVQITMSNTAYKEGDDVVQKLRLVESRLRQLRTLVAGQ